jgi:HTH-type transcriptional regulator / antitoxin HipB
LNPLTEGCPLRSEGELSALLASLRRQRGLSQKALAQRLGVTQQTLSDLERNAGNAGIGRILVLLAALGAELVVRERCSTPASAAESAPAPSPA